MYPVVTMRFVLFSLLAASLSFAVPVLSAETPTTSSTCTDLLKLAPSTMARPVDKVFINNEVCEAYKFLIDRYEPGPRSSVGLSNPKVEGIIYLNPDFAVRLAKMLKAAPYMKINSAYRTPEGQGSKNPESNHIYGCAVDLGYSQNSCGSAQCQWVLQNAGNADYKLQIRMKYAPEWNHIEPIDREACRAGKAGNPNIPSPAAPLGLGSTLRQALGASTQQPTAAQPTVPSQPLSASQSPIQGFQEAQPATSTTNVSSQIDTTGATTHATSSVADRLEELAFGTSSQQTTTGTSVPLVVSGSQAVGIVGTQTQETNNENAQTVGSAPSQQTFVSGDLSWQGSGGVYTESFSGWRAVLFNIEITLRRVLQILQPFGVRNLLIDEAE